MGRVEWPTAADVAAALEGVMEQVRAEPDDGEGGPWVAVWLQVYESGWWKVHSGDIGLVVDEGGFWGEDYVGRRTKCAEVAASMIEEARDFAYIAGVVL